MEIKLYVSGVGSNDSIDEFIGNIGQYLDDYDELDYTDSEQSPDSFKNYKLTKNEIAFKGVYEGEYTPMDESDSPAKLTHHAEGLYEGTNVTDVHVEVFFDNKWYGGNDHEVFNI